MRETKEFNQIEYINNYIKKKYDRINLVVPAGSKQVIKSRAAQKGKSVNQYINELIDNDLKNSKEKKGDKKMKKFEIVKTTAEISWKERDEIKEGCTMYDVDPEKIASFGTKEEAEKELKKYKTDVCTSGSLFTVEEFSIQENEYDEDDEWIGGGDIWKFTPMEIFVVDKETRKTIAKAETYEEAEEAAEEYEGDAGADIVFYE
jgi:hypothetical protein